VKEVVLKHLEKKNQKAILLKTKCGTIRRTCFKHFVLRLVPVSVLLPIVFVSEAGVHFLYILVCLVHIYGLWCSC
jgi:hypothetical protein